MSKMEAYHKKYRQEVIWEDNPLVCEPLAGCTIDVRYNGGDVYGFRMDGIENIEKSMLHEVTDKIDKIRWCYWIKWGWSLPFFIKVDDGGKFILMGCKNKHDRLVFYDKIMHCGRVKDVQR